MTSEKLQTIKELTLAAIEKMKFPQSLDLKEYNNNVVNEICKAYKMISETVLESVKD